MWGRGRDEGGGDRDETQVKVSVDGGGSKSIGGVCDPPNLHCGDWTRRGQLLGGWGRRWTRRVVLLVGPRGGGTTESASRGGRSVRQPPCPHSRVFSLLCCPQLHARVLGWQDTHTHTARRRPPSPASPAMSPAQPSGPGGAPAPAGMPRVPSHRMFVDGENVDDIKVRLFLARPSAGPNWGGTAPPACRTCARVTPAAAGPFGRRRALAKRRHRPGWLMD